MSVRACPRGSRGSRGRRAALLVALATTVAASASGAPPAARPAPKPAPPPLAPLPMLPSVCRVRVEVLKAALVVIEEVLLPRGEWSGDALDLYVAFGAPGVPRAIDAHLLPVADGALEPEEDEAGEALALDRAPRRPPTAHALLGKDAMAGVVVHVKKDALTRALVPGSMAALRMRMVLDLPEEELSGARGVVVRLGASRGTPLTLGRLSIASKPGAVPVARAEAHLCGPEADPTPLAVARLKTPGAIAPVLAVRHATDDLCLRFWRDDR